MTLSYNLAYQDIISVHPTLRQIFAGKPYSTFWNIWDLLIYRIRNIISHLLCPGGSARQFAPCTILPLPMLPTLWERTQKILSLYRFVEWKVQHVESWSFFVVECHCCRQYSSEESRSGTWSEFQKKKMKVLRAFPFPRTSSCPTRTATMRATMQ